MLPVWIIQMALLVLLLLQQFFVTKESVITQNSKVLCSKDDEVYVEYDDGLIITGSPPIFTNKLVKN
jgi:hypothetical protein